MPDLIDRPAVVTDEHLLYLDGLRASGVTNMMGAASYVKDVFDLSTADSRIVLSYWMKTFGIRHTQRSDSKEKS